MTDDLIERLRAYVVERGKVACGSDIVSACNNSALSLSDLRSLLGALEAAREDAGRWRHARKLLTIDDIEGAQGAYESFGRLISEDECKRADAAIDAAREARNG